MPYTIVWNECCKMILGSNEQMLRYVVVDMRCWCFVNVPLGGWSEGSVSTKIALQVNKLERIRDRQGDQFLRSLPRTEPTATE